MKNILYAVFDSKAKFFERPFAARSDGEATRSFQDICTDKRHPVGMHPEDYTLFRVATFDTDSGVVVPEKLGPQSVVGGLSFVQELPHEDA